MIATKLKIRTYGDPCLKNVSAPVKEIGPAERMLIASMIETMYVADGVGLAAPQVGVNKRIFVVDIGEGPVAIVNPKIVKKSGSVEMEEGCLSVPGINVSIKRPQKVALHYVDETGHEEAREFIDLKARAMMHEIDHLDGKTILNHASKQELRKNQDKIAQLENLHK